MELEPRDETRLSPINGLKKYKSPLLYFMDRNATQCAERCINIFERYLVVGCIRVYNFEIRVYIDTSYLEAKND